MYHVLLFEMLLLKENSVLLQKHFIMRKASHYYQETSHVTRKNAVITLEYMCG